MNMITKKVAKIDEVGRPKKNYNTQIVRTQILSFANGKIKLENKLATLCF